MNSVFWLVFQVLNTLSSTITGLFLSIFVWQKTGNIIFLYIYFLTLFVLIPIFGFISSLISEKYSFKIAFLFSTLSQMLFLLVILLKSDIFIANPVIFGILNSISIAFYSIPRNSLFQILNNRNISSGNSILNSFGSTISLIVPLLGSMSIKTFGNYNVLFIVSTISLLAGLFAILFINIPKSNGSFDFSIFKQFSKSEDFLKMSLLYFLNGIKSGIEWPLLGIILLNLVEGNMTNWGYLNSFAALVGIILGFIYSKYLSNKFEKHLIYLSSISYTVFGIFLLVSFNLSSFIVYLLGTTIASSINGPSFSKLVNDIFIDVGGDSSVSSEYSVYTELPLMLGRILSLGSLFVFNFDLNSKIVLGVLFFILSIIPFASTYIIQKTKVFSISSL